LNAINTAFFFPHHPLASMTLYDHALIHANAFKPFKHDNTQCSTGVSVNLLSVWHTHTHAHTHTHTRRKSLEWTPLEWTKTKLCQNARFVEYPRKHSLKLVKWNLKWS